ncbi:hypothetical protein [uncultured Anaerococcus sp.]|uniref:hypothetical protein n=1 Tax=uncultured Anaerococcus sp. TaxID=293428 RepID=UPI00288AA850|nr:hypothetical protein [uncultured Anaerococcus sp.]
MTDKKFEFDLTQEQVKMINTLIEDEFKSASDMNTVPCNGEKLIKLYSYLNFKLGFWKGREELVEVKDE